MKKYILVCLAIVFAIQACKKDEVSPAQDSSAITDTLALNSTQLTAAPVFVYKKINKTVGYNKHLALDVNADGKTDLNFTSVLVMDKGKPYLYLLVNPQTGTGNKLLVQKGTAKALGGLYTYPLKKGDAIKPATTYKTAWNAIGQKALIAGSSTTGANKQYLGLWTNQVDKYLGFTVIVSGKPYYGWIKITHLGYKDELVISELAYNKAASGGINAGQK